MSTAKQTTVPFLPGYRLQTQQARPRSQGLAVKNGVMMVDSSKARLSAKLTDEEVYVRKSLEGFGTTAAAEAQNKSGSCKNWIRYEGESLVFVAYFTEDIVASSLEKTRYRKVKIVQHLADGTVAIVEPRIVNSGIPQGVLVKRHLMPKGEEDAFGKIEMYQPGDFLVGGTYTIYGNTYKIVACSDYTRNYVKEQLKITDMPENEPYPTDDFERTQMHAEQPKSIQMNAFVEASLGRGHIDVPASRQFFANDGKVLRFYCTWQDPSAYGEKHPYTLLYYLADDTVEVNEIRQSNSGREQFPSLLKRSRLPRNFHKTVANVATIGGAYDALKNREDFITFDDMRVGGYVDVFGRKLLLCSCDEYTKGFYKEKFGLGDDSFTSIKMFEEPTPLPRMAVPPYNGFGTEEDSLGSFNNLVPRPPRKDLTKLVKLDGKSLRFMAMLANPAVEDVERRFVITYYMADDTVSIFEKAIRNSGFVGGKFLERSRVKNPETDTFIAPQQFFVGARLTLNRYKFKLLEADEYTLKFMEEECSQFPQADSFRVRRHLYDEGLLSPREAFDRMDTNGDGRIDFKEFTAALEDQNYFLTEHEALTLLRQYDTNGDGKIDFKEFCKEFDA